MAALNREAGKARVIPSSPRGPRSTAARARAGGALSIVDDANRVTSAAGGLDLTELYATHYRELVRLASIYVDDLESAEEVTQDAFVKLLAGSRRYRVGAGNEAAYLRSAVLNGARSALRRRRVRRAHKPEKPRVVPAAELDGVRSTQHDQILDALRQLPARQASVLVLKYYLDLSEAEIADTLGIARGSVKSHTHRGLAKLAKLLPEELDS